MTRVNSFSFEICTKINFTLPNDINITYNLKNFRNEYRFLNFCVGKTVNWHLSGFFSIFFETFLSNINSFDVHLIGAVERRKRFDVSYIYEGETVILKVFS